MFPDTLHVIRTLGILNNSYRYKAQSAFKIFKSFSNTQQTNQRQIVVHEALHISCIETSLNQKLN